MSLVNLYLKALSRLTRGVTKYGLAPHKPVLLITLIELFDKGSIVENCVPVNAELVATFKENWLLLVSTAHQVDFTQPFYYLQSERVEKKPYWFLLPKPGSQINVHIKSVTTLAQVCEYGYFNSELFLLMSDTSFRAQLKQVLLNTYFPLNENDYHREKEIGRGYFHDQLVDVLNESEAKYRRIMINSEEDVFVRNGLFRKLIRRSTITAAALQVCKLAQHLITVLLMLATSFHLGISK